VRLAPGSARLVAMKTATPKQRLILDAAIDRSVIHGTLTAPSGDRRDFHGWLELNTALEAALDPAGRASGENRAASPAVAAKARDARPTPAVTKSANPPAGRSGTQARAAGAVRTSQMPSSRNSTVNELDSRLRELKREDGHVFMLEGFRRQFLDTSERDDDKPSDVSGPGSSYDARAGLA